MHSSLVNFFSIQMHVNPWSFIVHIGMNYIKFTNYRDTSCMA